MIAIAMAVAFSCSTVGGTTICTEVDSRQAVQSQLIYVLQRKCVSKIQPIHREKYPGGAIQLMKDCEKEARAEAEALSRNATRNVDQNGVQSR